MTDFLSGDDEVLSLDLGSGLKPVSCSVSHSIGEQISEFLETCKIGTKGEMAYLPRLSGYSISFEGVASETDADLISWSELAIAKRDKIVIAWQVSGEDPEAGQGYISNLEKTSPAGDYVSFSMTITGTGAIVGDEFTILAVDGSDDFDWGGGDLLTA